MRRAIAISLLMLFSWTLLAPLLAPGADANLPACCRRNGKHHCNCMMRGMGQLAGNRKGLTAVSEKCPCCPASACVAPSPSCKPEAAAFHAEAVFHPAPAPQPQARSLVFFLSSHPKRGPPTLLA